MPYEARSELDARSILVLAPHPDDEIFGCGGLLALASQQRRATRIVIVSDGAAGGEASQRESESRAAAAVLGQGGLPPIIDFWRLPDRRVQPHCELIERISEAIRRYQPHWVLAPSPYEVHPDHRAVSIAAVAAVSREMSPAAASQLVFFEIGQPMLPNLLIDITPVLETKIRAMECFASQLSLQRYDEHVLALNRYRSYTLGPAVRYAEAYWHVNPSAARVGMSAILAEAHLALEQRVRPVAMNQLRTSK